MLKLHISLLISLFISSWSIALAETFQVQRLGNLNIPKSISKVFIPENLIESSNDQFGFKAQVIKELQTELSKLGRYQVFIGEPTGFDPNTEVVAVIQGDVVSGGGVVSGQMTEKAVCKGGLSGIGGAVASGTTSEQGITVSGRGFLCKKPDVASIATEAIIELATGGAPIDEVIRIYKYKNVSLFLQVNLSMTQLGTDRTTLLIRSESAGFSRHYPESSSYANVRESSEGAFIIMPLIQTILVAPMPKRLALVQGSNVGSNIGRFYNWVAPEPDDIPEQEMNQIRQKIVTKTLRPFIRDVTPYRISIEVEIDDAGTAADELRAGKFDQARQLLEDLESPSDADLYHLGLTLEATAITQEDLDDARRLYSQAFDLSPKASYAKSLGRLEKALRSLKKSNQSSNSNNSN